MSKKKKIILIISIIIVVLLVLAGLIVFVNNLNKESTINIEETKTTQLYEKITNAESITFVQTLDDNNSMSTYIKGDNAYEEVTVDGDTSKYIVKDGDTYYLNEENKIRYKYQNNTEILTKIRGRLEELKNSNSQISTGRERINGKSYRYEEFLENQDFLFNTSLSVNNLEYAKTILYYDGDELVYIKTVVGENEEITKIDMSYDDINDEYFNILENYSDSSQE